MNSIVNYITDTLVSLDIISPIKATSKKRSSIKRLEQLRLMDLEKQQDNL